MSKVSGIYLITCRPEGRLPYYYVGQSVDVAARLNGHKNKLKKGNHHNRFLQFLWQRFGPATFCFEFVEDGPRDKLDALEAWWLEEIVGYSRVCNFAISPTAPMRGVKFSDEHKRKLGDSKRGDKNWTRRIGFSQEMRQKMSRARRGRTLSDDVKRRMSQAQLKRYSEKPKERGAAHASAKPIVGVNEKTGETLRFPCMNDARDHGFSPEKISLCCNGHRPRHRGFTWKFDDGR